MSYSKKKILIYTAKILFSAGLLLFIAFKVDWTQMYGIVCNSNRWFLALALFMMVFELFLMSLRLMILMMARDISIPFKTIFKLNIISVFVGIFLPTKLGVDGLRIYYLSKYSKNVTNSIFSITYDRLINLLTITTFAIAGFFIGGYYKTLPGFYFAILPMILVIIFLCLCTIKKIRTLIRKILNRLRIPEKVINFIDQVVNSFIRINKQPKLLSSLLLLSVIFQSTRIIISFLFARAFGVGAPIGYFYIIIPIVTIISMLPISIAGLGVPQGTSVYLLSLIGVPAEASFSFSISVYVGRLLLSLPGGYFFLREGIDDIFYSLEKLRKKSQLDFNATQRET